MVQELDVTEGLRHTHTFPSFSVLTKIFYPQIAPEFYLHYYFSVFAVSRTCQRSIGLFH